jgi:uncharacterized metal-binding protein
MEKESLVPECSSCPYKWKDRLCRREDGKFPDTCPTNNKEALAQKALKTLEDSGWLDFARQSSIQEGEGYGNKDHGYDFVQPIKPRIQEIYEFGVKMGLRRLGLVFCVGLRREAKIVGELFKAKGFELASVICKVGRIAKEKIGILDKQKIAPGYFESACNPVLQAMVLNEAKTDFNIVLGLCVGHDTLFFEFSEAPCTVLAVKDRLLGHNPLAAVYNLDSYYRAIKKSPE